MVSCVNDVARRAGERGHAVRDVDDPSAAGLEYAQDFVRHVDQFVLGEVLDDVESDDRVAAGIRKGMDRLEQIALYDAVNAKLAGRGHLSGAVVDAEQVRVAGLARGVQQGAVTAAEIENGRVARRREMARNQPCQVGAARRQSLERVRC
jgi:hypothetical protein